jgi:hypothetical protein
MSLLLEIVLIVELRPPNGLVPMNEQVIVGFIFFFFGTVGCLGHLQQLL